MLCAPAMFEATAAGGLAALFSCPCEAKRMRAEAAVAAVASPITPLIPLRSPWCGSPTMRVYPRRREETTRPTMERRMAWHCGKSTCSRHEQAVLAPIGCDGLCAAHCARRGRASLSGLTGPLGLASLWVLAGHSLLARQHAVCYASLPGGGNAGAPREL